MSGRRRLGLVAAAATLMAAAPLSTIYDQWTWLIQCAIAVGVVCGAATLARSLRAPIWVQALAMIAGLLLITTWIFRSGEEIFGLLPGPGTFAHFGDLASKAMEDMRAYGIPVPDRDGLLFLTVVGVGGVAIVVDLLTVGLRRPALAGLPMLAIYSVPVAIYPESVPTLLFVIGAVGYLWLLVADNVERVRRFGRRFTGDGRDVDVWAPSPLAAAGRRLAVVGVVAAVAIPLAVPTFSSGLLTRLTQTTGGDGSGTGRGGSAGKVDLFASLSGQLRNTETVQYLTVTTENPQPYYLRFGVADTLTPEGFRNQAPNGRPANTEIQQPEVANSSLRQQTFSATVSVTDRFDMPMLPVYANTLSTEGLDSSWYYDDSLQIVYSNRRNSRSAQYSFTYVAPEYTAEGLREAGELEPDSTIFQQYTQRPELTAEQQAEVTRIVSTQTAQARTQYDKARALYDYFSKDNGFTYSLQTESGSTGSDLLDFLDNKVGFCQQYATALAWLLREAKIPARVAFGFTRGTATGAANSYALTNQNLHAWTEVYFDGFGWVPFDATPAQAVPGSARGEWAPDVDASPLPSASAAPLPSTAPGAASSAAPGERPDRDPGENTPEGSGPVTPQGPRWPWYTAAAVIVLLALLAVPALLRSAARRRRSAPAAAAVTSDAVVASEDPGRMSIIGPSPELERSRSYAHAAWAEMLDTMIDFQVEVNPAETPRSTVERLARAESLTPEAAAAATLLGSAEEHARYARTPLDGNDLGSALARLRQGLSVHATRTARTRALLMPPSVLRRWKLTIGDRYASIIGLFGRWRDVALRLSPRRLLVRSR